MRRGIERTMEEEEEEEDQRIRGKEEVTRQNGARNGKKTKGLEGKTE